MYESVQKFAESLTSVSGLEDIRGVCRENFANLGFDRFAFYALNLADRRRSRFFLSEYPMGWIERYVDKHYIAIDPAVVVAFRNIVPFGWNTRNIKDLSGEQGLFYGEAGEFGITKGISVPIHGLGGEFSSLSLTADVSSREFSELYARRRFQLALMGMYLNDCLRRNMILEEGTKDIRLTSRENECLLWTSRGKTAWEISEILKISEETVKTHLKNTMKKFGVRSKHHAVIKALITERISL